MAKLRTIASKLQTALTLQGRYIMINQTQVYSEAMGKMFTKYVLRERRRIFGKNKNVTLLETFRLVEVVTFLAAELNGG